MCTTCFGKCPDWQWMRKKSAYTVAVVGAIGAVDTEMLSVLEERKFLVEEVRPLASSRSAGGEVSFRGEDVQGEITHH